MTFEECTQPSNLAICPVSPSTCGFWCLVMTRTPLQQTSLVAARTAVTSVTFPLSEPAITCTVSPTDTC